MPAKTPSRTKKKATTISRSNRAGLKFPVGRMHRLIRQARGTQRVGGTAAVFMAATLEYITSEILELAGDSAGEKHRITPRHLQLSIK